MNIEIYFSILKLSFKGILEIPMNLLWEMGFLRTYFIN